MGQVSYFLVFDVTRNCFVILLNQSRYAQEILKKANMHKVNPSNTLMALGSKLLKEENKFFENPYLYKSIIKVMQYLTLTILDLSFSVHKLSQFLQNPTQNHWKARKRVLKYIKGTYCHCNYFNKHNRLNLKCFTDAD